jgi:hypothetical protein
MRPNSKLNELWGNPFKLIKNAAPMAGQRKLRKSWPHFHSRFSPILVNCRLMHISIDNH